MSQQSSRSSLAALTLGSVGVVCGGIGTRPLYALKEEFATRHVELVRPDILGVLSLVFRTLTFIVALKHEALVLRANHANNNGEGGTMARMALSSHAARARPRLRHALIVMGIFGAVRFDGDAVITPAISVLSAVEGLELAAPAFKTYVVPITLALLFALYAVQKLHGLKHDNVLQETQLFVTARTHDVPWAPFDERASAVQVARGCSKVTLNFGFRNDLDVPAALQLLAPQAIELDPIRTSHLLSRETVVRSVGDGMASWRDLQFAMRRNAASAADLLNLPASRVVELGTKVQT